MVSVLLADDHALVRAGMRRILADEPSISEIGDAASGTETLTMMRRQFWDLLVSMNEDDTQSLPHECLTERELQIMLRIAEGMQQPAIAEALCIAPKTVSARRPSGRHCPAVRDAVAPGCGA